VTIPRRGARGPRLRRDVVLAVFAGGCLGGWARYGITAHWTAGPSRFPWATLVVNTAGAFVLGVIVVVAAQAVPSRYVRPLLGTGFCGAFTTFSSVVVGADELVAHGHAATAAGYLLASIAAGLLAAWLGVVGTRAVAALRTRPDERSAS
jgi:CrcB protein